MKDHVAPRVEARRRQKAETGYIRDTSPPPNENREVAQPLPERFKKNGLQYRQIKRRGMVALFEVRGSEIGPAVGFEVFIVQRRPAGAIMGKWYPARETDPSNEDFGTKGWAFSTQQRAEQCFQELNTNAGGDAK